jgi:Type II CAAX prenyl endopeptidase Rce1-like
MAALRLGGRHESCVDNRSGTLRTRDCRCHCRAGVGRLAGTADVARPAIDLAHQPTLVRVRSRVPCSNLCDRIGSGTSHVTIADLSPSRQWYLIPLVYVGLYLLVIGEELGWRGFALPVLQRRWSALLASLLLAIPWTIRHFAILINPVAPNLGSIAGLAFIPFVFAISIIITAVFSNTDGSLLAVLAYHASGDVTGFFLVLTPRAYDINVVITVVVAVLLVLLLGREKLSRASAKIVA